MPEQVLEVPPSCSSQAPRLDVLVRQVVLWRVRRPNRQHSHAHGVAVKGNHLDIPPVAFREGFPQLAAAGVGDGLKENLLQAL